MTRIQRLSSRDLRPTFGDQVGSRIESPGQLVPQDFFHQWYHRDVLGQVADLLEVLNHYPSGILVRYKVEPKTS